MDEKVDEYRLDVVEQDVSKTGWDSWRKRNSVYSKSRAKDYAL